MPSVMSRPRSRFILLVALALVPIAIALRAAPPARASQSQVSVMMDDNLLVYSANSTRMAALKQMKSLGVSVVRATLLWSDVAHGTKNPATHHRFNPANPSDYPKNAWVNYDQLVVDAQAVGIKVYFDVTGPGPAWAMGKTSDPTEKPSYMPNVSQFGKFVQAVGTRFSGKYHGLPRVSTWSIWNEPNQVGWLSPQGVYNSQLHEVLPYSPILYRQLWYAARGALNRTGHTDKTDTVLVGETAPLGSPPQNGRTPMRPATFIQQFFCVNSKLKAYTGLQASVRGCGVFKRDGPIVASGWAHHPYTKAEPPTWNKAPAGSIVIANIAALPKLLDGIAKNTRRVAKGLPVWITEMGYETNPPDPTRGVSLADQASYNNETDWMAYKQSRVAAVTQFLLEDTGPNTHYKKTQKGYWDTYQSGLEFGPGSGVTPGTQKPAYNAYAMPIWISATGPASDPQLSLWAQARFRAGLVTPQDGITFQFLPAGSTTWIGVTPLEPLNPDGFVNVKVPENAYGVQGTWRAIWLGPTGYYISRDVAYTS
jgi:Cellulase (glycosyl hydrolase family 5)